MLFAKREELILSLLQKQGVVAVRDLAALCHVTEMTIRRDLTRLEARNLLRRTHGGAIRVETPPSQTLPHDLPSTNHDIPDALILAPVQDSAVHTLREMALRNQIPLLAESAAFPGAVYLGPNNYEASFRLGQWTGEYVQAHLGGEALVLDISLYALPNTRARSAGFVEGLRHVLRDNVQVTSIDGRGFYNEAYQVALDALRLHPEINVIFGVNDDSVLGGLQAYCDLDRDPAQVVAVNVGGEGSTLFHRLYQGGPLKACMALFPEVVGRQGIEGVARLCAGENIGDEIITPSALITTDTLTDFYAHTDGGWVLKPDAVEGLEQTRWETPLPPAESRRVSFIIHYGTHEWYQSLAKAMKARADQLGMTLSVQDVKEDLQAEIRELRRLIGKMAASYVSDGDTIILDTGTPTTFMSQFLQGHRRLTVFTNSLAVLHNLQNDPEITLHLIGGEFRRESQSFVGRAGQLFLHEIRADKVFIVAGGVSPSFGVSSKNLAEAEMRQAMINAAREVVVLADHTVLGADCNVRVVELDRIHTLITDAGAQAAHRLDLNQRGIKVMVAGQLINGITARV